MNIQPWISVRHAALSELTLVILTYNRPVMVQRLLNYLHTQAPEVSLVLVDHGDTESQESNAAAVALLSPEIRHLRLSDKISFAEVLVKGCAEIKTQFSALCPDDDIPVIEGIIDAVSMLITDTRMVCAQGYVLSLNETDSAMYFGPFEDSTSGYVDEAPLKRLFSMMRRYQPVFFGFYRTEILVWVIHEFAEAKIFNLNVMFQEFFHAALVCSRGAIGRSQSISLWRRVAGSHTDRRAIHPCVQLIDNPTLFAASYQDFCEQIIPYYMDKAQSGSAFQKSPVRRTINLVYLYHLFQILVCEDFEDHVNAVVDCPDFSLLKKLSTNESCFDAQLFQSITDFRDVNIEVLVYHKLLDEAAQVSQELSLGTIRERKISTEMLIRAIRSALDYRFS